MSRSKNHSCGCALCKPWKHKADQKLKPSERRKLQEDYTLEHPFSDEARLHSQPDFSSAQLNHQRDEDSSQED